MGLLLSRRQMPQFKWRPQTFQQGASFTLPAPYGGLNLRDDITALKPNEARVLENWVPTTGQLAFRSGNSFFAGGMGTGEIKTLASFIGFSASKLLAGADGRIFDVTSGTTGYTVSGVTTSANDTYTKVYLPFTGLDGGTTINDRNAGGSAHTWAAAGNANTDTAQFKFTPTSLACDGTGDWVTTNDHADFTLGTSAFTIDLQVRPGTDGAVIRAAGQADSGLAAATSAWYMARNASDKFEFYLSNGSAFTTLTSTTSVVTGSWFHIRAVRSSNTIYLFVNGALEASSAFSGTVPDVSVAMRVGAAGENTTTPWNGWIDEYKFDVGIARNTAAFTAPTLPYAPTEMASGFSEDRWQTALYSDRLFFVNGIDNPQVYDGSTVAAIAWAGAGLTDNDLINIALVRNRLWFCEKNQAWVWYGDVGQITAASNLTKFDLSQIAGGGFCMAVGSWSVTDAGQGADDFTVFVMSTGEIIVYQGDPATTFSKIGSYMGAPPIGRQCLVNVGGELVIITRQGLLPVSAAVRQAPGKALNLSSIDPWGKIAPGFADDAESDAANAGWHGVMHLGYFYGNVPQTVGSISKQWVLNTRTGGWTIFKNWNASQFASFGADIYFGAMTGGRVMKVSGGNDNGESITCYAVGSFQYPTRTRYDNVYNGLRPIVQSSGTVTGVVGVDTDFIIRSMSGSTVTLSSNSGGTAWGSAWGSAWGGGSEPITEWLGITGEGAAVAVKLRAEASSTDVRWFASDILYKAGGLRAA